MKNIYLVTVTLLTSLFLYQYSSAQSLNVEWESDSVLNSNNSGFAFSRSIVTDPDGNVYIAGEYEGNTITFGDIILQNVPSENISLEPYSGQHFGIYLVKYDNAGNVLWAKSFGSDRADSVKNITLDAAGNIYMTGGFMGTSIPFDNITLLNTYNHESIYTVKLTNEGNVIWAKSAQGTYQDYIGVTGIHYTTVAGVAVNAEGNVFIAGKFRESLGFNGTSLNVIGPVEGSVETSLFLIQYDVNGNVISSKKNNATLGYSEINFISLDGNDNLYVGGHYLNGNTHHAGQYSLKIDNYTLPYIIEFPVQGASTARSGFIIKFDSGGNVVWGNNISFIDLLITDKYGNIITARTGYEIDETTKIKKYNTAGILVWEKTINLNPSINVDTYSLAADIGGNIFISGYTMGGLTIDGMTLNPTGQYGAQFILKCNPDGTAQWGFILKGADNITISDSQGNIYITGRLFGSNSIFGADNIEASGVYTAKLSGDSIPEVLEQSQLVTASQYTASVYPNPVANILNISADKDDAIYNVSIYNTLGQTIITKTNQSHDAAFTINMSQLQAGYYMLEVNKKSGRSSHKIIKK